MPRRPVLLTLLLTSACSLPDNMPDGAHGAETDPSEPDVPLEAFRGQYFNATDFTQLALTRVDPAIDFDWADGSPAAGVNTDFFSVRWEGDFEFAADGMYRFTVSTDDGMRVFVDGAEIVSEWQVQPATAFTAGLALTAGVHRIEVEYYEQEYNAVARVSWARMGSDGDYPPGPWDHVYDGMTFTSDLLLFGPEHDNTLVINCTFDGGDIYAPAGIYMGNVRNVYIKNNVFRNSRGALGFSAEPGDATHDITVDGNEMYNHSGHAIWAGRDDQGGIGADHTGMRIINNTIHDTGLDPGCWAYHMHAIYLQNNDYLIENNTIYNSWCGAGISVRASGTLRGNKVWNSQNRANGFWSDHAAGGDRTLWIENNVFVGDAIGLGFDATPNVVDRFVIRFNTVVMQDDAPAVFLGWPATDKQFEVYGNLLVSPWQHFIDGPADYVSRNHMTTSTSGFADSEWRLGAGHPARQCANGESQFPNVDKDDRPRPSSSGALDCGAYQYQP